MKILLFVGAASMGVLTIYSIFYHDSYVFIVPGAACGAQIGAALRKSEA